MKGTQDCAVGFLSFDEGTDGGEYLPTTPSPPRLSAASPLGNDGKNQSQKITPGLRLKSFLSAAPSGVVRPSRPHL